MTDWKEIVKEFDPEVEAFPTIVYKRMAEEIVRLRSRRAESISLKERDRLLRQVSEGYEEKLAEVTQERDDARLKLEGLLERKIDWVKFEESTIDKLASDLAASEAREIALRGAMLEIEVWLNRDADHICKCYSTAHSNGKRDCQYHGAIEVIRKRALAAQDPPPLLGVLREVEKAMSKLVISERSYEYNHDIAKGIADALAKLRAAIGSEG